MLYCIFASRFYQHKPAVKFSNQHDSAFLPVCVLKTIRAKRCCAALGYVMESDTLCHKRKADDSAGIQSFDVNTVQRAGAEKKKNPVPTHLLTVPTI